MNSIYRKRSQSSLARIKKLAKKSLSRLTFTALTVPRDNPTLHCLVAIEEKKISFLLFSQIKSCWEFCKQTQQSVGAHKKQKCSIRYKKYKKPAKNDRVLP